MIKERTRKKFTYNEQQNIKNADLVFTEFKVRMHDANANYNSRFMQTAANYLSTSYVDERNSILIEAFCEILLKKDLDSPWEIDAIQPLPGMLKIQLRHQYAFQFDCDGEESCKQEMNAKQFTEAKKIYELFEGYTAVITYTADASHESWGDFVLDIDNGSLVVFDVEQERTTIKMHDGRFPRTERKYVLTWKNQKHKKFYANITSTFVLENIT